MFIIGYLLAFINKGLLYLRNKYRIKIICLYVQTNKILSIKLWHSNEFHNGLTAYFNVLSY